MKQPDIRNKWSKESIDYLKTAYLHGYSLKWMSAKLNRSVSAINKIMTRHNLRTQFRDGKLPSPPCSLKAEKIRKQPKPVLKNRQVFKSLLPDYRSWVPFEYVLKWLKVQNVSIIKPDQDVYYLIDGYPKNRQQILHMANMLREEKQLPVFFVKGITSP